MDDDDAPIKKHFFIGFIMMIGAGMENHDEAQGKGDRDHVCGTRRAESPYDWLTRR